MVEFNLIGYATDKKSVVVKAAMILFGGLIYLLVAGIFGGTSTPLSILLARTGGFGFMMGSWIAYIIDVSTGTGTSPPEIVLTVLSTLFAILITVNFIIYFTQFTGIFAVIATLVAVVGGTFGSMLYVWTAFFSDDFSDTQHRKESDR